MLGQAGAASFWLMRGRAVWALISASSVLLVSALANAQCTKDTDCKGDRVCEAGKCTSPVLPPAPPAPPGNETPVCASAPLTSCRMPAVAHKASLKLTGGSAPKLAWKWMRGAATTIADFGDPTGTTSWAFCVYGGAQLLATAEVAAGGTCAGKPCWIARSKGFRYADRFYSTAGIGRLDLQAGATGRANTSF